MSDSTLSFTGERFLPECGGEIWYEHWHRYAMARQLCAVSTRVIDVASGEGYGAALLAEGAARVVGVDISREAVIHARTRYASQHNLEFVTASCDSLPFATASFDLAVSFETIEHIEKQKEFIAEIARVLHPDGVLVISSPNKLVYTDAHDYHNEFHVRELYRNELEDLLMERFPHIAWFGQKLLFNSVIWPDASATGPAVCFSKDGGHISALDTPGHDPMYFLAVCSRNRASLPASLNKLSLFGDKAESVYMDYIGQTRRVIELDNLLKNREQLIAERDEYLALRTRQMEEREQIIAARDERLAVQAIEMESLVRNSEEIGRRIEEETRIQSGLNQELDRRATFGWWLRLPALLIQNMFKADK